MEKLGILTNNLCVIALLIIVNIKETSQHPIKGTYQESEIETITANRGGDVLLPCTISDDETQIKIWHKDGGKIRFNFETTIHYAFINPQMILNDDGSLMIRNLKFRDSGTYICGGNGTPTILKVVNQTQPIIPISVQDGDDTNDKGTSITLPVIPNTDPIEEKQFDDENAIPLVANDKNSKEPSGSNTWLIILIILLAILVIAAFICIVMYKERDSTANSHPRFSPKRNPGESQYALKDCMEVDEDVTFIGTGQNIKDKQHDNNDNIGKDASSTSSSSSSSSSSSTSTLNANCVDENVDNDNQRKHSEPKNVTSPTRKTSNMSKSSSLFDCDCGTKENSSTHPCFK